MKSRAARILGLGLLAAAGACAPRPPRPTAPQAAPESAAVLDARYPVIPAPRRLEPRPGSFVLSAATSVFVSDPSDAELAALGRRLTDYLAETGGSGPAADTVTLRLIGQDRAIGTEGYRLRITPDGIDISASAHAGLFYGIQTLRQIVAAAPRQSAGVAVPAVEIEDAPRFPYRGMHLDVGRHLFPVAFIKRYIDLMAMYKMNTFHWHLTEDQGWRIQIRRYPLLTDVGSCRKETIVGQNFDPYVGDGTPYCGFYTQDEIRDIVAYARARYVTIVPEIEMPGHSLAALASYPELACTKGPFAVGTKWGVYPDIYCPSEKTFGFLEDVLTEVIQLFPSRYIHIGGDEAPKTRWKESPVAQEIIRREGLADEDELQSWFIRRIERFLTAHGRRLIGWDEILEGGLAPEATVMSWRGMDGGIDAAHQGHDVIMTPGSDLYFDHYQGDPAQEPLEIGGYTPLRHVYEFEPVPKELTEDEARHVLGAQGNVWTEYMATTDFVEYMVFPRLLALSEVVWSPAARRDWDSFARRLPTSLRILDGYGVNYRIPDVDGLGNDSLTLDDHVTLTLRSLDGGEIHCTTDGREPTPDSPRCDGPLTVPVDERGVTVSARVILPDGRRSTVRHATYRRGRLRPAEDVAAADVVPGLSYRYYEAQVGTTSQLDSLAPVRTGDAPAVALTGGERAERFGLEFAGLIRVPRDGIYAFRLTSDDGSVLTIDGRVVVDHDGLHGPDAKTGMAALAAGFHPIVVRYFQAGGGKALALEWVDAAGDGRPVTPWLFHAR